MARTKTTSALWARLAVDYYRNPKIISAGPWGELAWIRLLALARETIETSPMDGAVVEILALREIRDITDVYTASTGRSASDLLDEMSECGLISRHDGLLVINDYGDWQTTQDELKAIRKRGA